MNAEAIAGLILSIVDKGIELADRIGDRDFAARLRAARAALATSVAKTEQRFADARAENEKRKP